MALSENDLLKLGVVYPRDAAICDLSTPCDVTPCRSGKGGYATQRHSGSAKLTHRLAYASHRKVSLESLDGVLIRHLCHNSACRNPLHLAAGSAKDNAYDNKLSNTGRWASANYKNRPPKSTTGKKGPRGILTAEQVRSARSEYVAWSKEHGATALAKRYGVTLSAMHDAISGRKWKEVK